MIMDQRLQQDKTGALTGHIHAYDKNPRRSQLLSDRMGAAGALEMVSVEVGDVVMYVCKCVCVCPQLLSDRMGAAGALGMVSVEVSVWVCVLSCKGCCSVCLEWKWTWMGRCRALALLYQLHHFQHHTTHHTIQYHTNTPLLFFPADPGLPHPIGG